MSKIKVLHVHTLPVISGSGINTLLTACGLDTKTYDVSLACAPGGALASEAIARGITFCPIPHFVQPVRPWHDCCAFFELVRVIRKGRYHIVHTHNSKAGFIGRLAARIAGSPVIVHTVHGFAFHDFEKPLWRAIFRNLERLAAPVADALIVISRPLREWGLREGIGSPEQYEVIYSGIEIEKFNVAIDVFAKKRELGIPPENSVIGVVAKLWDGKGHETVLEAARLIVRTDPKVTFLLVGEGYLEKRLRARVKEWGLEGNVIFAGFRADIPEITAVFDISVLASFFEGLGRVLLEAMSAGKPVVASRVGGIVDIVDDGKTGFLVLPHEAGALAGAIAKLLADPALRRSLGQAGREKISAVFSAGEMIRRIEGVYRNLLRKKNIVIQ